MEHVPPPAEELALLDRELARLDARRAQLLTRRAWLVRVLGAAAAPPAAGPAPWGPPPGRGPVAAWGPAPAGPAAGGFGPPQASAPGAQNVLLVLGGLLLTVAALAFTLVSWGDMGIGGRSAVLTAVTAGALLAPVVLLRRGLSSTAEALAALATVLMVLDAYALYEVAVPDADGAGYTATAAAVLAVLWGAYGLLVERLRLPLPLAVCAAQLPLVLWAWAADGGPLWCAAALLVTAALDGAVALRAGRVPARVTACVALCVTGGSGLLVALVESLSAAGPAGAVVPGALLLAGAALAVAGARRAPAPFGVAGGVVAGLASVAAVGGVLAAGLPDGWPVLGYLLCGGALLGVRAPLGAPVVRGLGWASGAVVAGAVLASLPPVTVVAAGPVSRLGGVWAGVPRDGARGAVGAVDLPWAEMGYAPVVLLLVAVALGAAYRWWEGLLGRAGAAWRGAAGPAWRGAAGSVAVASGWSGLLVLPVVLGLSFAADLAVRLVLVIAAFAAAVTALRAGARGVAATAGVLGAAGALGAGVLSLATEAGTYTVFGLLLVVCAGLTVALDGRAGVSPVLVSAAACAAVVCAGVPMGALGASLGWTVSEAAVPLLAVPAVTVLLGARLKRHAVALPVELTGAAVAAVAAAMAVGDARFLALVLALCGVLAAGTALRAERRPFAGYLATGLFVLAAWVRLSVAGVSAPEAYTLPVTVPALVVGMLRRQRDPAASSWAAYGAGLAVTLVPSLGAAWTDAQWTRPLLLGLAALGITLVGARLRLQALLVLGGAVLALDALHELAPYVVQVAGALPRWVVPALAGVLLLAVGATYEKRLRDARRLREALGRMR
ncbi:SCO7613 C-terminal domain-containing membrane protein [Streptomyces sp. NPDC013181]|uniref:SCO7613 C-terminal domain-containing membrane protein n=1 Tax=Streptomyces sp. NPDC013181 TaxID=3364864 RepID=UPI00369C1B78